MLESIINEMTNTLDNMQCISPLRDYEPSSSHVRDCKLPSMGEFEFSQYDFDEIVAADTSISDEPIEKTYERAVDIISECAVNLVQELIVEEEVESLVDSEEI